MTDQPDQPVPDEELSAVELAYQQALKYGQDLRRIYLAEKAKRQELELTNQLLSAVFASTPDGLVVLDDALVIQSANPVFHQLVEKANGTLEGQPLEQVLPAPQLITALRGLSTEPSAQAQIEFDFDLPVKRSLLANFARLDAGQQRGWVLVLRDQTEHKRLEYQKTEFINIAAHELRTPLSSLIGLSELLWEYLHESDDEDTVQCVDGIRRSGHRLSGVVDQLIAFTQLTEGSLKPGRITEFYPHDLVLDIISELQPHADEKQVTLHLDDQMPQVSMLTNAVLLRAALVQLIMNGINFNQAGGKVTILLERKDDQVFIQIIDTGIGIPQTEIATIFEPFFQVDEHSTRRVGGLGLGLPIVEHAVLLLGGVLSVDSTLGSGARFQLALPLWQPISDNQIADLQARLEASHQQSLAYARDIRTLYEQLRSNLLDTLATLASTLEARDEHLRGHSERVAGLALRVARQMGYTEQEQRRLEIAARVHEIGKIGLPDAKLHTLDDAEGSDPATVPYIDLERRILEPLTMIRPVVTIALAHHERYDGQGYPGGLAGEAIPHGARILAVANAYDRLTSPRPNYTALPPAQALETIQAESGTRWDPAVVEALVKALADSG